MLGGWLSSKMGILILWINSERVLLHDNILWQIGIEVLLLNTKSYQSDTIGLLLFR